MIVFSKKNKNKVICAVFRAKKASYVRKDISNTSEFLQVSIKKYKINTGVKRHIHKKLIRKTSITQEIWIVLKGKIFTEIFDIDKNKIKNFFLKNGDVLILYRGGHSFKTIESGTIFYEIKNGPYYKFKNDIEYF
jgi:hypothetical protein